MNTDTITAKNSIAQIDPPIDVVEDPAYAVVLNGGDGEPSFYVEGTLEELDEFFNNALRQVRQVRNELEREEAKDAIALERKERT